MNQNSDKTSAPFNDLSRRDVEEALKAIFNGDMSVLVEHKWTDAPASYLQPQHSEELKELFDLAFADLDSPQLPQE